MIIKILPEKNTIDINETIRVDIMFDAQGKPINAIGGDFSYNPKTLKVESVITGNSLINFWIDSPENNPEKGLIHFSGMIPGGTITSKGDIFSVVFSGTAKGVSDLSLQNTEAYINDGNGTMANIQTPKGFLAITGVVADAKEYVVGDKTPPEKFEIIRARDPNIFDGHWFATFAAQDQGSGIAHYEICESFFRKCVTAESPVQLYNQSSFYSIRVKAYDHDGNVQGAQVLSPLFSIFTCITAVIIAILVTYVVYRRKKIFHR